MKVLLILCLLASQTVFAGEGYESETLFRSVGFVYDKPDITSDLDDAEAKEYRDSQTGTASQYTLRNSSRLTFSDRYSSEVNAYVEFFGSSQSAEESQRTRSSWRSSALEKQWYERQNVSGRTVLDRFSLSASFEKWDFTIGRQPINLGTTVYFTPNDLFEPFYASAFYREYKPGVDALRFNYSIGDLTQISYIAVAGYEVQEESSCSDEDCNKFVAEASANLIVLSHNISEVEIGFLGGRVDGFDLVGGSLQSELPNFFLIRAEGHHKQHKDNEDRMDDQLSIGLEKQLSAQTIVQIEKYYNGVGYKNAEDYSNAWTDEDAPSSYLARHYSAVGVNHELTSLFYTGLQLVRNDIDGSVISSINGRYSISDESDLTLSASRPFGKRDGMEIVSEYGLRPSFYSAAFSVYF